MKKIIFKLRMVCFLMLGIVSFSCTQSMHVTAATQIKIDKKTFPGEDFRRYIKRFDKNKNGYLSKKEIKAVKKLQLYDELFDDGYRYSKAPVLNMKGMKYFTNVRELDIGFYRPKNFDTAKMKKLKTIRISSSYLKVLDLRENKNLITLDLFKNNVTKIKFASSSKLKNFSIDGEKKLKKPDFASLKNLENLRGQSMPYKKLDLRKCKNLKSFFWNGDRLKKGALQEISFGRENIKLTSVILTRGSLTSIDWLG